MTIKQMVESAKFRTATTEDAKVLGAWELVREGAHGNKASRAILSEAVTSHDFPRLLARGVEEQVNTLTQTINDETAAIARLHETRDFRETRYRDLFLAAGPMRRVLETAEYKSRNPFAETHVRFRTVKFGERYGMSWEAVVNDEWDYLLGLPSLIVEDAKATHNHAVYSELVTEAGAINPDFFPVIGNESVSYTALKAARKEMMKRRFKLGTYDRAADMSTMVFIGGPAAAEEARAIVNAGTVKEITGAGTRNVVERVVANPLAGLVIQESEEWAARLDPEIRDTAWALVPGAQTRNPSLLRGKLRGHAEVEVRVKSDTGQYVNGGAVDPMEGNYGNDVLDFRGRTTGGVAKAFNYGSRTVDETTGAISDESEPLVYASTGTQTDAS